MRWNLVPEQPREEPIESRYETYLWKRAEEIEVRKAEIDSRMSELFAEVEKARVDGRGSHQIRDKEKEYWDLDREKKSLIEEETAIQQSLEDLDLGRMDEEAMKEALGIEEKKLSKAKQRQKEFEERIMSDPRQRDAMDLGLVPRMRGRGGVSSNTPPPTTHLTTGRHATSARNVGDVTPEEAEAEFYYRTADTHGGKVDHGKERKKRR